MKVDISLVLYKPISFRIDFFIKLFSPSEKSSGGKK